MSLPGKIAAHIIQNRIFRHILFWGISFYYLLHFFLLGSDIGRIDIIYTAVFHLPLVAGVYANLLYGMPVFLRRRRYPAYAAFIVVLLGLTVIANRLLFNYVIDFLAPGYFFVSDLSWQELLEFEVVYIGLTMLIRLSGAWFALQESRNRLIRMEKEKAATELAFLKGQINPHFLFNSLNNIYGLVLKKDSMAPSSLLKLSSVMRYMIYESNGDRVPLEKEIAYIEDYIELQRLRVPDASGIVFDVEGDAAGRFVAPLVFVVFIENAFKHGGGHSIYVGLRIHGDRVELQVTNGKVAIDDVDPPQFSGLGIANVRRRLDLLYPDKYGLTVEDRPSSYTVHLHIPFIYQ